ncbi:DUF58 domain-containing protein [Haloarcula laminariae]|uniref:DUF58 domain-containing protein n=1 Tax=Haloarcula laminariae TaxID=2961577 RepID=UPI0021C73A40|nr:DUF58 domain-containing protein [Halomicroarcula laminariae]
MEVTRRFTALAGTGLALAALALLFERPVLLVSTAGIGGILLATQLMFVGRLRRLDASLAVDLDVPRTTITADETVPVTLSGATAETPLGVTVTAPVPASAEGPGEDARRIEIDGPEPSTVTFDTTWPVVGQSQFDAPIVRVTDPYGLFGETFTRGPTPAVRVEPHVTRTLHVGQGGDTALATFGEHATDELGDGVDPAELRQYVAGDSAGDIDWKATARLNEPYIREHEVETDRRTVLFVDHRAGLATGPDGETKLDYIREVALTLAEQARAFDDPLGLYTVGDEGLTTEQDPSLDEKRFRLIQDTLYDLQATGGHGEELEETRSPGTARRASTRLQGDRSAFGTTLRPYLDSREGYVTQIASDPLFAAARTHLSALGGTALTVVFTDDQHRTELRETVKVARQGGNSVVVFLTPHVLFESGGLSGLDAAYERYADFESFRRDLAALDRVTVYEVGPGDRLEAVLSAGR